MKNELDWARDSHSELQLRDVKNLMATAFDREYVAHWTETLALGDLWRECER